MVRFEDIKFNCRLYNGYKPCIHGNECAGCPYYDPLELPTNFTPVPSPQPVVYPADANSILIIKTGAMGDVLRTTTLLHGIKRRFPKARVTWVTAPECVPLLKANPFIHELLPFSQETCAQLEHQSFDVLLNFEKEKEPLLLAGRIHAHARAGFAATPWNTPAAFNQESSYAIVLGVCDELKFHINTKTYPQIISEMAALPYQRDPYVLNLTDVSHQRRTEIEALLQEHGLAHLPRVGLNTGCGTVFRTKQWTLEGWCELIEFLQERTQAAILLMGGKAEEQLNRDILARCPHVIDTGTGNSLEEFFGVIDGTDVVVTSDTLGMHISIALAKYTVALFGSTSHHEIDLYDRGEKIVTDFKCSPCYKKTCDFDPMCMIALRGNTVGEAALRGLAAAGKLQGARA